VQKTANTAAPQLFATKAFRLPSSIWCWYPNAALGTSGMLAVIASNILRAATGGVRSRTGLIGFFLKLIKLATQPADGSGCRVRCTAGCLQNGWCFLPLEDELIACALQEYRFKVTLVPVAAVAAQPVTQNVA